MGDRASAPEIERLAAVIVELRRTMRRAGARVGRGDDTGAISSRDAARAPLTTAEPGRQRALTGSEQEVLRFVASRPGVGTSGIAAALRLRANTVSGVCSRLVRAGHLERRTDPDDSRAAQFYPTEATLHRRAEKAGRRAGYLAPALDRLPESDRTAIATALPALERLVAELDALAARDR